MRYEKEKTHDKSLKVRCHTFKGIHALIMRFIEVAIVKK